MGGRPGAGPIDRTQHELADWEITADAVNQALVARGVRRTDESRRAMEDMPEELYHRLSYYERWIVGLETLLTEKGLLTSDEIDRKQTEIEARLGQP
jgi:nitrile hydratase